MRSIFHYIIAKIYISLFKPTIREQGNKTEHNEEKTFYIE